MLKIIYDDFRLNTAIAMLIKKWKPILLLLSMLFTLAKAKLPCENSYNILLSFFFRFTFDVSPFTSYDYPSGFT